MAITIADNFRGQKNKALDDRAIHNTKEDALTILRQRGANGLTVTVLHRDEVQEDGSVVQIFDPLLYVAFYNTETSDWDLREMGGSGGEYTNAEPSVIAVGGIGKGTTFDEKSIQEMFDMMLYPELFPTLTNPSLTLTLSKNVIEVGAPEQITAIATFSRGSISPSYGTNGFRAGAPTLFSIESAVIPATGLQATLVIDAYSDSQTTQSIAASCTHAAGQQPLSSKGNNYSSPYPVRTISATRPLNYVLPHFATTVSIAETTKQALEPYSAFIEVNMAAESTADPVNKQRVSYPSNMPQCTGIQIYNTLNNSWEWLNGSQANSQNSFTSFVEDRVINNLTISYRTYAHKGSTVGARSLRFYIT